MRRISSAELPLLLALLASLSPPRPAWRRRRSSSGTATAAARRRPSRRWSTASTRRTPGKIKVSTLAVPYDAFADKITAAVPRGKGPDVFIFAQDRLGGWIAAGNTVEPHRLLPRRQDQGALPQRHPAGDDLPGEHLRPAAQLQGHHPDLQQEAGADAAQDHGRAGSRWRKKLTNARPGKFGLAYWYSDFYYHAALMNGFGGGVFGRTASRRSTRPPNVKSLDSCSSGQEQGFLPGRALDGADHLAVQRGQGGDGLLRPLVPGRGVEGRSTTAWRRSPRSSEAGNKPMRPWITVEGVYIAAPSKNKDAAFEFAKYLTDVPAAKVLAARRAADAGQQGGLRRPAGGGRSRSSRRSASRWTCAVPMPNLPEMTMVWSPATTAMNTIVKKAATPKAGPGHGAEGGGGADRQPAQEVGSLEARMAPPSAPSRTAARFLIGLAVAALLGVGARRRAARRGADGRAPRAGRAPGARHPLGASPRS